MDSLLRELAEPFERMTQGGASALVREHYGFEPLALESLETERDDTFRVTAAEGDFVLKIAHPGDDPELIAMQSAAMAHVASHGLPVQRVLTSLRGERQPIVGGRVTRLLTWIDGELLLFAEPSGDELRVCGATLARLASALRDFDPPAAHRTFAWDLQRFGELSGMHHPASVGAVFDRMAGITFDGLPHQVIHNDFHPGNILVDGGADGPGYIVGILDFGDMLYSARIVDIAVSLAYLVPETGESWKPILPFIEGYESVTALLPEEKALLPRLVAARLAQRIIIPSVLANGRTDILHAVDRTQRILDNLLTEG